MKFLSTYGGGSSSTSRPPGPSSTRGPRPRGPLGLGSRIVNAGVGAVRGFGRGTGQTFGARVAGAISGGRRGFAAGARAR